MTTDLTFITNEKDQSLLDRFKVILGHNTRFFDCLVGYFFSSGFYALSESFAETEKIRILIGISTDLEIVDQIKLARQNDLDFTSHAKTKEMFATNLVQEMDSSADQAQIEKGVAAFIEWLSTKKVEIRAYPSRKIHAKLYIMTFGDGDRDVGRVITGSSNFTEAGLRDNLEFNVELKNSADYKFAKSKFDELWAQAVDVSERFVETINNKTWLNNNITPYELYLKFLYEYFKKDLSRIEELEQKYVPQNFRKLEYQEQAVANAKRILDEYGGVFISDVVGLGKTYISAMLAGQLEGRNLVLAPPALLDEDNPGSWPNVFHDFRVASKFQSIGKLEDVVAWGTDQYDNVFIDESHKFRTESNKTYELLAQICRGKRIVLISATPLNNTPRDILSQIKLFQKGKKSTIPSLPNLEEFFNRLQKKLDKLDRRRDREQYIATVRDNAKEVREKVLKYLMIRRTRTEVVNYFGKDLEQQGISFPEVADPVGAFYQFDQDLDKVFQRTVELITSSALKYARYKSSTYLKEGGSQSERIAQENLTRFMKVLLVKRLDSSFYAFKHTVGRFIHSYEHFLDCFRQGFVFIGKRYLERAFDLFEEDDFEGIDRLVEEDKVERHKADEFKDDFITDLEKDLSIFKEIHKLWEPIHQDPKLKKLVELLTSNKLLSDLRTKIIVFTESKETAEYLAKHINSQFSDTALLFHGSASSISRSKVIENFDAKVRIPKDDYRILITTDVLAEGVNLHRSNAVVNYDIPWNATKMMQRVGRINRVDTKFDEIFTFNFFPTQQSNDQIKLEEAARAKIEAFIHMLGSDAKLLTNDEEVTSFDLFVRLNSKKTIIGEDENEETELKYLQIIKDIREKDVDLFARIKHLPKKARSARHNELPGAVISYIRKKPLEKFYLATPEGCKELDFFEAADLFEADVNTPRKKLGTDFFELLEKNKTAFDEATIDETPLEESRKGMGNAERILIKLKSRQVRLYQGYTEEDDTYLKRVMQLLEEGAFPPTLLKRIKEALETEIEPLRIMAILRTTIPSEFLKDTKAEEKVSGYGPVEVILSEYLTNES